MDNLHTTLTRMGLVTPTVFTAEQLIAIRTDRLASATTDAYSFAAYGRTQWVKCVAELITRGYNDPQIIAILYSKVMRMAADARVRANQKATCGDLARFLALRDVIQHLTENLDDYVLNILGEDLVPGDEPTPRPTLRLVWSR